MQTAKKKRIITISVAASLAAVMVGVGATLAVLTKTTESRANNFTFGNINIELDEPEWDEEDNILYPGRTVSKDPTVTNTGKNDLYVFLEVSIPKGKARYIDDNGEIVEPTEAIELLSYDYDSENWMQLSEIDGDDYHTVLYVYKTALKPDEPDNKTTPLFTEVTFVNAVEGEPAGSMEFDMPITAYAIQSEYLSDEEIDPSDNDSFKTIMQNAFDKYLKESA